jgi:hypothetical protein
MDLKSRVINILTKPKEEWPVISAESTDVAALYKEYIAPLAAIPAVCGFLGMSIIGIGLPFVGTMRTSLVNGLAGLILRYALSLGGVYAAALIIDKLAPKFQSTSGIVRSLKMVAYASTASWVASAFLLIPALSPLVALAGLYGIYLYYLGLPVVMNTPEDRVIPYMAVSAVVIVVIFVVVGAISSSVVGVGRLF